MVWCNFPLLLIFLAKGKDAISYNNKEGLTMMLFAMHIISTSFLYINNSIVDDKDNTYIKIAFAFATSIEVVLITLKFMKFITVFEKFAKIVYLYKAVFGEIWRFMILFIIFILMFTLLNYIVG